MGTDHFRRLRADASIAVSKKDARRWFSHMCAGVAVIHSAGYVHWDIQPSNIWLTKDLQSCKIAGLGISRPLYKRGVVGKSAHNSSRSLTPHSDTAVCGLQNFLFSASRHGDGIFDDDDAGSNVGGMLSEVSGFSEMSGESGSCVSGCTALHSTNPYSSPELLCGQKCNEMTDIFSIGCILLEMMTLAPLKELNMGALSDISPEENAWSMVADVRVRCFEFPDLDMQTISVNCTELPGICNSMLNIDPTLRPQAHDIIARSSRIQAQLTSVIRDCPKLRDVVLKKQRKVHFRGNDDRDDIGVISDSESEPRD